MIFSKINIGKSGNPKCPYEVHWNNNGKYYRKRFKFRGDAEVFALELREEAILPESYRFTPEERANFATIKTICIRENIPISEAVDIIKSAIISKIAQGCVWEEATKAFLADTEHRGARAATIDFYRSRLGLFASREGVKNVAEITAERAEKYLATVLSPEHAKRALRAFFNFCVGQKWIKTNPFKIAKTPRKLKEVASPSILSPADAERFLQSAPARWAPTIALMAFAGIRPNEIVSLGGSDTLRIGDIDFTVRKITIRAEVSKGRRARILTALPANLWEWIEPLRGLPAENKVAPASYDVWRRVKTQNDVELPKDVFRHSFASYAYHYLGAEHTVEILGHIGGFGVFAKHYKGLSDPDASEKYFAISPQKK